MAKCSCSYTTLIECGFLPHEITGHAGECAIIKEGKHLCKICHKVMNTFSRKIYCTPECQRIQRERNAWRIGMYEYFEQA